LIKSNKIRCDKCQDVIESTHRHDFKWCKCGSIAVDGGTAYLRRVGAIGHYTDLSEEVDDQGNALPMQERRPGQDSRQGNASVQRSVAENKSAIEPV
jgi:hypothetical protein